MLEMPFLIAELILTAMTNRQQTDIIISVCSLVYWNDKTDTDIDIFHHLSMMEKWKKLIQIRSPKI